MSLLDLLEKTRRALASGSIQQADDETTEDSKGHTYGAHIRTHGTITCSDDSIIANLAFDLERLPETGWMFESSYLGCGIISHKTARWLLAKALKSSPEDAIELLKQFAATNEVNGKRIIVIYGAYSDVEIRIDDNTRIVPLSLIQPSLGRDAIIEQIGTETIHHLPMTKYSQSGYHVPALCAIEEGAILSPALMRHGAQMPKWQNPESSEFLELIRLGQALSLLPHTAPQVLSRWCEPYPFDIVPGLTGGQVPSIELMEVVPKRLAPLFQPLDQATTPAILLAYKSLPSAIKNTLDVPLKRLGLARIRRDIGDQAIEICISLEALFGDQAHTEISHRVGARVAMFLSNDADTRRRNYAIVKKVYDIRSRIVHGGSENFSKKMKIAGAELTLSEVVSEAIEIARLAANKIVVDRSIPNWAEVDLGLSV